MSEWETFLLLQHGLPHLRTGSRVFWVLPQWAVERGNGVNNSTGTHPNNRQSKLTTNQQGMQGCSSAAARERQVCFGGICPFTTTSKCTTRVGGSLLRSPKHENCSFRVPATAPSLRRPRGHRWVPSIAPPSQIHCLHPRLRHCQPTATGWSLLDRGGAAAVIWTATVHHLCHIGWM